MAEFKDCCDPGTEWGGSPVGQVSTLASLDAYISKPKNALPGSPAILLIHDIHGWDLKNVRLYADKLAKEGFLAVVPDFYHGKAMKPLDFSALPAFIAQFPRDKVVPELHALVKALREEHGATRVGAQGFCWGGLYTALLLAGSGGVDAGVISHGSLLKEEDVKAIERPVWFQFSGPSDKQIPPEFREQIEELLKSKPKSGSKYYEDQVHAWVMRGDDEDPRVAAGAADAFQGALDFFRARLGGQ